MVFLKPVPDYHKAGFVSAKSLAILLRACCQCTGRGHVNHEEVHHSPFQAAWSLPAGVDTNSIMACFMSGHLLITLRKRA